MRGFIICTPHYSFKVIKSRRVIWTWHVAYMGAMRNAYKIFVRKLVGMKPFGRPRCILEDI
jgi:hypothetical protein